MSCKLRHLLDGPLQSGVLAFHHVLFQIGDSPIQFDKRPGQGFGKAFFGSRKHASHTFFSFRKRTAHAFFRRGDGLGHNQSYLVEIGLGHPQLSYITPAGARTPSACDNSAFP